MPRDAEPGPGLTAGTITDPAALTALAPAWLALWVRCPQATPFTTPHWLLPWWRHFHPGALRAIVVRRGDRLVALAPLYLEDGAFGRRLLPIGISLSDFSDVLLDPGESRAAAALMAHAAGLGDAWSLEELAPEAAALALPCPPGWRDARCGQSACPELTLSGRVDADGLPLEVPAKRRANVRRAVRAASKRGLRIERPAEADGFLDQLTALHRRRWDGEGEASVLADPAVQGLLREALPALLSAGQAHLATVRIGGVVAGALLSLRWGGTLAPYLSAFDPAFAAESPLAILFAEALREAAAGLHRFSFLRGREPYKYLWGATDRWNTRRTLTPGGA